MKKQKSLKLNFIMNALLTMSSFIFPLITFPYVSRVLGPTGTGQVNFATSLITYFSMFAQLGIPTYGIKVCAQVRDDHEKLTRTTQELLIINLVMTVISYVAFIIALFAVPKLASDKMLYVITSSSILLTTIGMEWLYKALEQFGHYNFKRHFKPVAIFFAMSCATTIYTNLDSVMLGFMATNADVGYYGAAVKIKNILVSIVTSLGTVLLPRAAYYIEHQQMDEFKKLSRKALNFVFLVASPMMIYFMLFAKQGIYFLSGDAFGPAVVPMQLIMPTLLLIGITNILGIQILVPLGYEKAVLVSEIVGAVIDLVVNALLIPVYQSSGAAIGTLLAEFAVMVVQCIALKNEIKTAFSDIKYLKIILAIIIASLASFWVTALNLHVFITLVISAILFFGVYGLVLIIMKEKLVVEILTQIFSKLKHKSA